MGVSKKTSSCKEHLGHAMLNVRVTQWSPMSFAPSNVDALPVANGYRLDLPSIGPWQRQIDVFRFGSPTVADPRYVSTHPIMMT